MARWGDFVGREGELSRLQWALADGGLVLVVGDAGIGKTRFVAEGLTRASIAGMLTIGGGCLPLAAKPPLLPVADALAELTRLDGGAPFEAALAAARPYVRPELARLLPRLAAGEPIAAEPVEGWRHERILAGVAELLDAVARRSRLGLLVEDVHWADGATLDFLTYLTRPGRDSALTVLVTCRSDEVPLDPPVAEWLTRVRRDPAVEEIRLGPLSQSEVAKQVAALIETPPPGELVAEVYTRAEGHPFFTEQLVTAAVNDSGQLVQPMMLPVRLAELLVAQVARCGTDARAVASALAVAGRPMTEGMLVKITDRDPETVRAAVRELAAARLLAIPAGRAPRLRHALLAEAAVTELLSAERVALHERIAGALQAVGDEALAAEAAGHWAAAGRSGEELKARLTAARAAEQVFAYVDAATHWLRAIELYEAAPEADVGAGTDVAHLYVRAVDALEASGATVRARALVEEAHRRFADHRDRTTAARVLLRAASGWANDSPAAGLPLIKEALRLYEDTPPSEEHAWAWREYAFNYLMQSEEARSEEILAAYSRGLEIAKAAEAEPEIVSILAGLAYQSFVHGDIDEGFGLLAQARNRPPEAFRDAWAGLGLAITESDALLKLARFDEATRIALRGFDVARELGFGSNFGAAILLANAVEALLSRGRTAEAAALIDSRISGEVGHHQWLLEEVRADTDLLRGDVELATHRLDRTITGSNWDLTREYRQRVAELAVWTGQPQKALEETELALVSQRAADRALLCGWLLAVGMRACADLAELARARREDDAIRAALAAGDNLATWVNQQHDVPFTEHPFVATIPAARATWNAERSRAAGRGDAETWSLATEQWEMLGYRHRAGYARWRQAEALLTAPHGGKTAATAALSAAADLAREHVPLTRAIEDLARRARIDLSVPAEAVSRDEPALVPGFGLTDRELDVLRLLAVGRTNPEIAAALFISRRTVGVHVSSILRKLGATTRVQAATVADRAGLLDSEPPGPAVTGRSRPD